MKSFILIMIIILVLIPTSAVVANHVLFDRYSVLTGEGCAAYSIAMISDKDKVVPTPAPLSKDCPCKGTKKEKSGDGLMTVPCRCGSSCPCASGSAPKVTTPKQVRLIVFGAKWCGPCRQMHFSTEQALRAKGWTFGKGQNIELVDVDLDPATTSAYNVSILPCVIRIEDGKITTRYEGYMNAGAMTRVWNGLPLTSGDRLYSTR